MNVDSKARITLTDIAKEMGVSPATVSLALRNRPGVSATTRQQVQKTAAAMGYLLDTPTFSEQSQVGSIGVVVKDDQLGENFSENPFYGRVVAGIEGYCRQQHINLLYAHLPVDADNNPLYPPRLLREQAVDGLLFVGLWLNSSTTRMLHRQEAPIVLVDAYAVNAHSYDAVRSDNKMGGYEATKYLIDLGHHCIALVGSMPQSYPSIQGRRRGYERAIREHGLQPYFVDCHMTAEKAGPVARAYLQTHPEITAVFACNDEVAIEVMRGAQELGRHIPNDLAIIGFDDIHPARLVSPSLTTMRVDKVKMGRMAAQLLIDRIQQPGTGRVLAYLQPEIVVRESTRALSIGITPDTA